MDKQSKVISGFRNAGTFSTEERHKIIQEMLTSNCTKVEIWEKYTGRSEEHGNILRWMHQLGYNTDNLSRRVTFGGNVNLMSKKKKVLSEEDDSFEVLRLKRRILELEKQLKEAEMKAIAFSTMVDIAEKEFKIPIRKKLNTKP
jgi:transposase